MIEVADMRTPAGFHKHVEKRNGIGAAGDANEQRLAGNKQF